MNGPNTPSSGPQRHPDSVLYDIHRFGAGADLSHIEDGVDMAVEEQYARNLSESDRASLKASIEAYRNGAPTDTHEATQAKLKAMDLLHQLQDEIDPPRALRLGTDALAVGKNVLSGGVQDTLVAADRITDKVAGDMRGMVDPSIGLSDKILTGAKYALGVTGILWLGKKIYNWWKVSKVKRSFAVVGGGFLAWLGLSKLFANATDRSMGPRLAPNGPPPGAPVILQQPPVTPPTINAPAANPNQGPAAPNAAPQGAPNAAPQNAPNAAPTSINVAGSDVSLIAAGNSKLLNIDGRKFDMRIRMPFNTSISLSDNIGNASVNNNGGNIDIDTPGGASIDYRIPASELSKIVTALRGATGDVDIDVMIEVPDGQGGLKKEAKSMRFRPKP